MLAHPLDDAHRKHLRFPCYAQPKLDGVRMMARVDPGHGTVELFSRTGKTFAHLLPHFEKELLELVAGVTDVFGGQAVVLDGELYLHGAGFQTVVSMAKNTKDTLTVGRGLQYHLYDLVLPRVYEARLVFLSLMFDARKRGRGGGGPRVALVHTEQVMGQADVTRLLSRFEREGYEGVMLRDPDGAYAAGKRSNTLLKLKSFLDAEFAIVGVEEAGGKDAGTAVFVCETRPGGKRFRARPHGTSRERADMLRRAPELLGKKLTVRYQEMTDGGVPRFPVGVAVRDYE
jgi:ATP-dependent DNA ligase